MEFQRYSIHRSSKRTLVLLVLLHCVMCLVNQILFYDSLANDSIRYIDLAKQYASLNFFDPHTNCYGHPFYSLFLLVSSGVFSYSPYFIGFIQSVLFGIATVFVIRELEHLYRRSLGGLLLLILMVPEFQIFNGYALTESLGMSLFLFCFALGLNILNKGASNSKLGLLSFLVGCAILNRLESIVILPVIYFLMFPAIRTRLVKNALLLLIFPLLFVLINCFRNHKIFGLLHAGSFNGGEVVYGGNNPRLDGSHHNFLKYPEIFFNNEQQDEFQAILAKPECESCPQRHYFFTRLAKQAWKDDPVSQISTVPLKLGKNWLFPAFFDIYTADLSGDRTLQINKLFDRSEFGNKWYAPWKHGFYIVIHWALLGLIFLGLLKISWKDRFQVSVLMLFIIFLLFAIPFCGLPRWHLLVFPALLIAFCPAGVLSFLNRIFNVFEKRV